MFKTVKHPDYEISYSSYPACISSTDDFFMVDRHMVVTETSLDFDLTKEQKDSIIQDRANYIPEFYKVMASN